MAHKNGRSAKDIVIKKCEVRETIKRAGNICGNCMDDGNLGKTKRKIPLYDFLKKVEKKRRDGSKRGERRDE